MAENNKLENGDKLIKQFDELKQKHPDALLLFRNGDMYQAFKEDALKAAAVLSIKTVDLMIAGLEKQEEKIKVKLAEFKHYELDTYLPKLIKAGTRVAICDQLEPMQKQQEQQETNQTNNDMAKKKKEQTAQEEPVKSQKTESKAEVKSEAKQSKAENNGQNVEQRSERKAEQKSESKQGLTAEEKSAAKQERKPREPQMITPDGGKVTHGHAYQSKLNPDDWYFTAKIDGKQLKPQKMDAADLAAYSKKEIGVPQLMERYYPTKLMPKVGEDAYKMPKSIEGPEGKLNVEKFNVYKEKDEQRPDFGKYKFYAKVGDAKMSVVASRQDLNAYFDRVVTPNQLVEKNFGERLHLKSAYAAYQLPEGVKPEGVRVAKDRADNKWKVSVDMGDKGRTSKHEISFDDGYALFKTKTATREQIAAKYLSTEIKGMLAAPTIKAGQSAGMKM